MIYEKNKKYMYMILIFISTCFMGLGYASINDISLNISGLAAAIPQEGVFITDVSYLESNKADLENTKITSIYQNNLNSKIVLENDENAVITYQVIIHNSTDYTYQFDGVEYIVGDETYSNENIIFDLNGLEIGDVVVSNDDIEFTISFKYKDKPITDCELVSLLNFKFSIAPYVVAEYDYTGTYDIFVVPHNGIYKIELWGASGGDDLSYKINAESADGTYTEREAKFIGGYGGYTSGEIFLEKNDEIYVYVGEMGKRNLKSTFNGGGQGAIGGTGYNGTKPSGDITLAGFSGGGATDIRLVAGAWNNFDSLKSRIMVAGGGGGSTVDTYSSAGNFSHAGGLIGFSGGYYSGHPYVGTGQNGKGGTQTSGGIAATIHFNATGLITNGTFGIGGYTTSISSQTGAGGGGGGYYGGSVASGTLAGGAGQGGGGGSSFISGHEGCNAIDEVSIANNISHTGNSKHYSGYIFDNTLMIDGAGYLWTTQQEILYKMPTYLEEQITTGNLGDGHARITFVSEQ